ncbi:MAG: hypothetical protein E6772_01905 [Dysgonomonas sp.]|nr:hypothetical protein [Dysgonomonas sp.]
MGDLVTGIGKFIKFLAWLILEAGTSGTNEDKSVSKSGRKKDEGGGMLFFLIFIAIAIISTIVITIWLFVL